MDRTLRTGTIVGWVWMGAALFAAGGLVFSMVSAATAPAAPEVGESAPALVVTQTDGQTFTLQSAGKPVLLDFWRANCVGCIGQSPILNRLHDRFRDQLHVLALTDSSEAAVDRFVGERNVRYAVAIDRDGWTRRFGVIAYPTVMLIDADGRVRAVYKRGQTEEALTRAIEAL